MTKSHRRTFGPNLRLSVLSISFKVISHLKPRSFWETLPTLRNAETLLWSFLFLAIFPLGNPSQISRIYFGKIKHTFLRYFWWFRFLTFFKLKPHSCTSSLGNLDLFSCLMSFFVDIITFCCPPGVWSAKLQNVL